VSAAAGLAQQGLQAVVFLGGDRSPLTRLQAFKGEWCAAIHQIDGYPQ
jgi:hypothetical protein